MLPQRGARGPEESVHVYHTFVSYVAFMLTCLANDYLTAEEKEELEEKQ